MDIKHAGSMEMVGILSQRVLNQMKSSDYIQGAKELSLREKCLLKLFSLFTLY